MPHAASFECVARPQLEIAMFSIW